jgi:hypothetical protein
MNELIEFVEDLQMIETVGVESPGFEHIITKWQERLANAEADMERQYEMFSQEMMS